MILSQEWKGNTKRWWRLLEAWGIGQDPGNSPRGQVCALRPCTLGDASVRSLPVSSPHLPLLTEPGVSFFGGLCKLPDAEDRWRSKMQMCFWQMQHHFREINFLSEDQKSNI